MHIEIKTPVFPESVSDATLIRWHKKAGDRVEQGDNLMDLETDKVVLEVPAPEPGVLAEIVKQEGDTVTSGEVLARLDVDADRGQARHDAAAVEGTGLEPAAAKPVPRMGPAARKAAAERGVSPAEISASGPGGRVTKEDVLRHAAEPQPVQPAAPAQPAPPEPGERPQQRVPMSRLRARVAERLVEAQRSAAMLTTFNEVDMGPVKQLRERYRERFEQAHGARLGYMSFFVKATVEALKRYPVVNASVEGSDIIYHGYFDIGIAVGSPRGLVVPVVRDADQLSFAEIEAAIADFGKRAQSGGLSIEELTGGTFTITNGGVFGSLLSTPILNPPQSAILGMHKIEDRPVVVAGQVVIRPMMYLALSYDHRIVDGREAVQYLVALKEFIEEPARLLLQT